MTSLDTIDGIGKALRAGDVSPRDLVEQRLEAAQSIDPLNAFTCLAADHALAMADEAASKLAAGDTSPLLGIPVAVKDLFCTRGVRSQACSRILEGFLPTYESTVTRKLWEAGAILLGKTNMDEFAMGSSTETSADGTCTNPWRLDSGPPLSPGGSSGGSAVAVATGVVPAALGTDTGGSIRQPASLTGSVGVKPTYGRCSRWGIIAFASSLDQAGPFARSVRDAALMLETISGHDSADSTSAPKPVPEFARAIEDSVRGMRVGIPAEYQVDGMPDDARCLWDQSADWLRSAGVETVEVSLPHTSYALPTYYIIAPAEASSNLARYDGVRYGRRAKSDSGVVEMYERTRGEGFGAEVRRRVLIGTYVLSEGYYDAYYLRAQRVRKLIREDFEKCFRDGVDALLTPTTPGPAFPVGDKADDPIAMYLNDVFTVTANLAGLPAVSIPAGLSSGLPLGIQLIGQPWEESSMLALAARIEEAAGPMAQPPRWWES